MSGRKLEETDPPMSNIAHPDFQPRRQTPWGTLEGRVISLVSRKGGVGKTTSAVNIGAALALSGHTVLIIGTDPQCGVCRTLGVTPTELTTCLGDTLEGGQPLTDMVQPSVLPDLFFVSPRILTLEEEETYLYLMERDADSFGHEIDRARHFYDTILIDCPPGLGSPTKAALLASDSFLVPVQAEELCRGSVESLLEFVDSFRDRFFVDDNSDGPDVPVPFPGGGLPRPLALEGIFLTMASTHTRMGRHVAARVAEDFGEVVFESSVPRTTRLSEMALRGKPAVIYDRRSPGSRAYFDLADELVQRYTLAEESMGLQPESSLPERVDPLGPEGDGEEAGPIFNAAPADGLDRFLKELGGAIDGPSSGSSFDEPGGPEIVSLDDLLAEEESPDSPERNDEEWDARFWNRDSDGGERFN